MKYVRFFLRYFLLLGLMVPFFLSAQNMLKQYRGAADPTAGHIRPTADGGYLLSGSFANSSGAAGMLVMKVDGSFQTEWTQVLQSSNDHLDYGIDAISTADGGYLVLGAYDTEIWKAPLLAKLDYCLVKLDAQGQIQWAKRYGGSRTDLPYELQATSDGGYLVSGYSSQGTDALGNPQPFLLKVDASGSIVWSRLQRAFAFNITMALLAHPSFQMKAIETADGGVFYGISSGEWGYLVKLDANGAVLWQAQIPMGGGVMGGDAQALWGVAATGGFIADIEELPNGDIALLGNVFYFVAIGNGGNGGSIYIPVAWIARITATGQVIHAQAFFHPTGQSGNLTDLYASDLEILPNGNFLVGGAIGGYKAFLLELDPGVSGIDVASVWARGFGGLDVAGYPYDYDIPHISIGHDGNYLMWYDQLELKQVSASNPLGDPCSHSLTINSFPFSPQTQQANVVLDSIMQEHSIAYQATALTLSDTLLCSDGATGIGREMTPNSLALYPNPTTSHLGMQVPPGTPGMYRISLTDLSGRIVRQVSDMGWPGEELRISVEDIPAGMYVVTFIRGEERFVGKVLVRH